MAGNRGNEEEELGVRKVLPFAEKHYRVEELADLWALSRETVRKLVKDDPGVMKVKMGVKRVQASYSVPASAAQRIHTRLRNGA